MVKTKTKRTIWTILALVAFLAVATIFYIQQNNNEPDKVLEDFTDNNTIKAEDQIVENKDDVVNDQAEDDAKTNTLEYISDYKTTSEGFNALGVSWEELNADETDIKFYIRVRNKEVESEWYGIDKILDKKESGVAYYAAETPVLAEGDSYQYKIIFKNKSNEVRNVKINVINTEGVLETNLFQKLSSSILGSEAVAAPSIISRAGWGAGAPNNTKTELQAYIDRYNLNYDVDDIYWPAAHASKSTKFIVHHTAGTNNPSDPAAAVRAIWVYHTFSRGWGDIGYNYLVDQYGKIYEGRYGGDHVIAGHAAPYNYDEANDAASIGVSVLGDFSTYVPSSSIQSGLAKIMGYKSYLYKINPLTASTFEDKYTYNIAGHRNYTATACPGAELYAKLPTIRSLTYTELNKYGHSVGDFQIDDVNPAANQPITASFTITNTSASATTLDRIKVESKTDGIISYFLGYSGITLAPNGQAGDSFTFEQSKIFPAGNYDFYIIYQEDGVWRKPQISSGPSIIDVTVHSTPYNVKMISSLKVTEFPAAGTATNGSFALENTGDQPVTYERIKVVTRNSEGAFATSSWAYTDVTVSGNSKYNFSKNVYLPADTYTLDVEYYKDGDWERFSKAIGVVDEATMKVYSTPSNLVLNSGIDLSKNNVLVGEPINASFTIANTGDQPVRLSSLRAYGLKTTGYKVYFPAESDIVLCKQGMTDSFCDSPGNFSYEAEKSFPYAGDYSVRVSAVSEGATQSVVANASVESVSTSENVSVQSVNYNNVVIKYYKLNDSYPAVGQPTLVYYRIYNNNNYPMTFERLKIDVRLSDGSRLDYLGVSNYTIPANSYVDRVERRVISSIYKHYHTVMYKHGGTWHKPVLGTGAVRTLPASIHYPNLKISSSLAVSPSSAMAGNRFTATFKIKNYENRPIYVTSLKTRGKVNGHYYDFPGLRAKIPTLSTYTYSQSLIIDEGVTHFAKINYRYYNGKWSSVPVLSGVRNYRYFKVYIETARLENIPLPATTGKTAREQHLSFTCQESRTHHYSISSTPLAAQNGMAWETSGGCGYGAWATPSSVANERYYIAMRWNYTDLHDQPIYAEKSWYYGKRVVITNPANGKKVVAAIIEYGPGILTRVSGLSPEAMLAIGAVTDNTLSYAWAADQSTPLGPAN